MVAKVVSDYWLVLKIDRKATKKEIKAAYNKLAKEFHPDVNKSPDAKDKFVKATEAYDYWMENFDSLLHKPQAQKRTDYTRYEWTEGFGKPYGFGGQSNAHYSYKTKENTWNLYKKVFNTFELDDLYDIKQGLNNLILEKENSKYYKNYSGKTFEEDVEELVRKTKEAAEKERNKNKYRTEGGVDYFETSFTVLETSSEYDINQRINHYSIHVPYGFSQLNPGSIVINHEDLTIGNFKVSIPKYTTYPYTVKITNVGPKPFIITFRESL